MREITLTSLLALAGIALLLEKLGGAVSVGAGTVLDAAAVAQREVDLWDASRHLAGVLE